MKDVRKVLFGLLRFEICGTPITEEVRNAVDKETLTVLYKISKMHDVAHLLADALHKNGLHTADKEIYEQFYRQQQLAVYRHEQIDYEYKRICNALEEAKIPFMPLKGSIVREYYPEPWMRTSSDIDVLVHPEHLGAAVGVLESVLQYEQTGEFTHDISLSSESGVHIEMHYTLIEERYYKLSARVLSGIWNFATPVREGTSQHAMTNEIFYFYHFAHMAKHFGHCGGSGIRSIIDVYLLRKKWTFDEETLAALLKQGNLTIFAQTAEKLARIWFEGEAYDELTTDTERYLIRGGVYGTFENHVTAQAAKKGRSKYIFSRIFESRLELEAKYPKLRKHKWLYPFYQVKRWFKYLFRKQTRDHAKKEMAAIANENTVPDLLKRLEL